jgi:sterol O-acyltransferase
MLPSTFIILLIFYLVFEGITNVFAEITKLNHREFYEDWWNSTTYEEFNRKWNKPVHIFLYRHVYLELILRWRIKKNKAQTITFLFSAMLHEFLLAMIFRTIRPIFLAFIIGQVPLIYLTKFMRGKKSGNYVFWLGIIIGPSIIVSCYLKISDHVAALFFRQTPHFNPILHT